MKAPLPEALLQGAIAALRARLEATEGPYFSHWSGDHQASVTDAHGHIVFEGNAAILAGEICTILNTDYFSARREVTVQEV